MRALSVYVAVALSLAPVLVWAIRRKSYRLAALPFLTFFALTGAIGGVTLDLLWTFGLTSAIGPVVGALISITAVLGSEAAKYYSSTSELKLSLGLSDTLARDDPGLDVEPAFPAPLYRISAMIMNDGRAMVRDAKASLTIKVRRDHDKTYHYYLDELLVPKGQGPCGIYLVNEYNPHVIGEELSWALPDRAVLLPYPIVAWLQLMSAGGTATPLIATPLIMYRSYQHIASISPGQRGRLLLFEFARVSDNEYLVMPFSEYGAPGPSDPMLAKIYRACLKLTQGYELRFEVTVHGEGSRRPLCFALCITAEKLRKVEGALNKLRQGGGPSSFGELLDALSDLRCDGRCK